MISRIALGLEYDGTRFHGWQRQDNKNILTIQATVEQALSKLTNQKIEIYCAGRTDAGVHAINQVIHCDFNLTNKKNNNKNNYQEKNFLFGVNSYLPSDIAIKWVKFVDHNFHARFSALSRSYIYLIHESNHRAVFLNHRAFWLRANNKFTLLDLDAMRSASKLLLGTHNFSAFRTTGCQAKSPIREIKNIIIKKNYRHNLIFIKITANGFLYNMVRNIIGVLLEIGKHKQSIDWLDTLLTQTKRQSIPAMTVPAHGLYFYHVDYPSDFNLL